MSTVFEARDAVAELKAAVVALPDKIQAKVNAALGSTVLTPETQQALDQIFQDAKASTQIVANV